MTPWKGLRVVLVGYTPGVPQNINGAERQVLAQLGFPVPAEVLEAPIAVAVRTLSVRSVEDKHVIDEEDDYGSDEVSVCMVASDGECLWDGSVAPSALPCNGAGDDAGIPSEVLESWDMFLPLDNESPEVACKVCIASSDGVVRVEKAEVSFTKDIEKLLSELTSPLDVVHTVDPNEAIKVFERWESSVNKELASFSHAVIKRQRDDSQIIQDLHDGKARIVPMKLVYTVKPPSETEIDNGLLFPKEVENRGVWKHARRFWRGNLYWLSTSGCCSLLSRCIE